VDDELQTSSLQDLINAALEVDDDDDWAYWNIVMELQRRGNQEVFDSMVALCDTNSDDRKRLGLDVLAQLGFQSGRPFLEQSLPVVERLADPAQSETVIDAAVSALGHLSDPRALPTILQFVSYRDSDVRFAVANALPSVSGDPVSGSALEALLKLMEDEDPRVRDWATFGLGSQLEQVDSPEVRQALWKRVGDPGGDTAGEALVGLAVRGDRGIVDQLESLLSDPALAI
jgi:HEAT repeat protein